MAKHKQAATAAAGTSSNARPCHLDGWMFRDDAFRGLRATLAGSDPSNGRFAVDAHVSFELDGGAPLDALFDR